jgi:hypothetical protein
MEDTKVLEMIDDIKNFIEVEQDGFTTGNIPWHALERVRSYVGDRATRLGIKQDSAVPEGLIEDIL